MEKLIKAILGEQVYASLQKSLLKLAEESKSDVSEIQDALKLAPKSVLAFLIRHFRGIDLRTSKDVDIPWISNMKLFLFKQSDNSYAGSLLRDAKVLAKFDSATLQQLAAHLLTVSEIYENEEKPEKEGSVVEKAQEVEHQPFDSKLKMQGMLRFNQTLRMVESKVDKIVVSASKQPKQELKIENNNTKQTLAALQKLSGLKKAGGMPGMPKPFKPGQHAGSQEGITRAGMHGDKTAFSDFNAHPVTSIKSPFLKQPKVQPGQARQAVAPKAVGQKQVGKTPGDKTPGFSLKSENSFSKCMDCGGEEFAKGEYQGCLCYKALSKPTVTKSENECFSFSFGPDWDDDSIISLWSSLKKSK